MTFANCKETPYYAVIFTSIRKNEDEESYQKMAQKMSNLVAKQEGFLGQESARENVGITVSYWKDLDSIKKWKENSQHLFAQEQGKNKWYKSYKVRICKVEREYQFCI
jgi:heme-degrading monooxygenase HmoA